MNIPNTPQLHDLLAMSVEDVSELPDSVFATITEQLKAEKSVLDSIRFMLDAAIELKFKEAIKEAYLNKDEPLGVVHIDSDTITLSVDKPRRVNWDQEKLGDLRERLVADPAITDPDKYVSVKYGVQERTYQALPPDWQASFNPARTVAPGKTTFKIKRKDAE